MHYTQFVYSKNSSPRVNIYQMKKVKEYFKKKEILFLIFILLFGLILRVYNFEKSFIFAHDQDLYSWIAKDIVVNKHLRLVGQITSVDGVFIGPLYYYLMAFSYLVFNMNPLSAIVPLTLIGLSTVMAFYLLGKKYYSSRVGLTMAFIYSVSYGAALYDKWSCPTELAVLWTVGFMYLLLAMLRKEVKLIPLFGILAGLTYHIHIALVPILPIAIAAFFLSGGRFMDNLKKIKIKNIVITILLFLLTSSPFWLFEIKHNFSQVRSTLVATQKELGNPTGTEKFYKVINASSVEMQQRLFIGYQIKNIEYLWILILLMVLSIYFRRKTNKGELLSFAAWIFLIGLAQFLSKRIVSEYYFTNYLVIFILIISLFIDVLLDKKIIRRSVVFLAVTYLFLNINWMLKMSSQVTDSYYYRQQLVDFIKKDADKNEYLCVGVNYISKFGDGVGFRYLFWYKGVKIVKPSGMVPTYNIVIPWEISGDEVEVKYGRFGLILPNNRKVPSKEWCDMVENQPDPLLGYTE